MNGLDGCRKACPHPFRTRRRRLRRVIQVQQVLHEAVIGLSRFREPYKEVFPCEQDAPQDAEILPVFVQSRRIQPVGVVMAVHKIHGEQLVQFLATYHLGLVHGHYFPKQGSQVSLRFTTGPMLVGTVCLSFF